MNRLLLTALFASVTAFASPLFAQEDGERPAARRGSPLGDEMKKVEKAVETVADFLKKPEGDAPIADVVAAQVAMMEAKKQKPRTAERQPADKQAKFVADYQVEVNKAVRALLDLEDALLQKDYKAAAKALAAIEKLEKDGHKVFKGRRGGGQGGEGRGGGQGRGGESGGGEGRGGAPAGRSGGGGEKQVEGSV